MTSVFYAARNAYPSWSDALRKILKENFPPFEYEILRTKNGKPFLTSQNRSVSLPFFSVSHTSAAYFIAISNDDVGVDAEPCDRKVNFSAIVKKLSPRERDFVTNQSDFLRLWTTKEAAVKFFGVKLATHLTRISYLDGKLELDGVSTTATITQTEIFGHVVCVCSKSEATPNFKPV